MNYVSGNPANHEEFEAQIRFVGGQCTIHQRVMP